MSLEDKVKETLDTIRPQLQADGGDLEYVKMEEGKVYVKLTGACGSLSSSTTSLLRTLCLVRLSPSRETT